MTHADGADGAPPIDRADLLRAPGNRAGKSRAPSIVGRAEANGHASTPPLDGPIVLDPSGEGLAGLALRPDRRAARYRGPMAPPMASPALDPALTTEAPSPPNHEFGNSRPRQHHDRRESAVGRAADPRRTGQAGHHGLGADRLSDAPATPSPAVTDLADVSDQSGRHAGVNGFLHGLHSDGRAGSCSCWSCSPISAGESSISTSRNIPRPCGRPSR
jgi:hypothetical protein